MKYINEIEANTRGQIDNLSEETGYEKMNRIKKLKLKIKYQQEIIDSLGIMAELKDEEYKEIEQKLGIANNTIHKQMRHIEQLNRQLDIQDKAIERKDKQFLGLRMAYADEVINRGD